MESLFRTTARIVFGLSTTLFLAGCPSGGGGGSVNLSNGPSLDNPLGISVTLTKINSVALADLGTRVDSTGAIFSKDLVVTLEGQCSLGVAKVYVSIDSVAASTLGICNSLGVWTWTNTFPSPTATTPLGRTYVINAKPALADGTPLSNITDDQWVNKTIVVDDQPPVAVSGFSVTAAGGNASNPSSDTLTWIMDGNNQTTTYNVSATTPVDAIQLGITTTGSAITTNTYAPLTTSFNFGASMTIGSQFQVKLKLYDRAGNSSQEKTMIMSYVSGFDALQQSLFTDHFHVESATSGSYVLRATTTPYLGSATGSGGAVMYFGIAAIAD